MTPKEKIQKDIKEFNYESPAEFLYIYMLGGCGCGHGDGLAEIAWEVFEAIATKKEDRYKIIYGDDSDGPSVNEAMAQWIDSKGLLEHGSSIGGSWLSGLGEWLYNALKEKPNNN